MDIEEVKHQLKRTKQGFALMLIAGVMLLGMERYLRASGLGEGPFEWAVILTCILHVLIMASMAFWITVLHNKKRELEDK